MLELIQKLHEIPRQNLNFKEVGKVLYQQDWSQVDYRKHIPDVIPNGYSRNILSLEPIEVLVLHWAPGAESAVHFHEGFWGYVAVLEGTCMNVEYHLEDGIMQEGQVSVVQTFGMIPEKDQIIHKIMNGSKTEPLITVHIYYPALESLDGLTIYDLPTGSIGILNHLAESATWSIPETHFKEKQKGAFTFAKNTAEADASHVVRPLIPKPDSKSITKMLADYYNDQAQTYDYLDGAYDSRKKYIDGINRRIGDYLKAYCPEMNEMLAIACGTGRRAIEIRSFAGFEYSITGLDLSSAMLEEAKDRDLSIIHSDWKDFDKRIKHQMDAATILYAFGHISTRKERISILKRTAALLRPGAPLFIDVFNMEDTTEWGEYIRSIHDAFQLTAFGYEPGDIFYSRNRHEKLAFLHYFHEQEIRELAQEAGFIIHSLQYVGYKESPGERVSRDKGNIFVTLVKE